LTWDIPYWGMVSIRQEVAASWRPDPRRTR
jgi:hypothetical protein